MVDGLRLRLLEHEIELMSHFALIVADDLDEAAEEERIAELPVLMQALIATALKISHLLWPYGRRATDKISVDEAGEIRSRLKITDKFPLLPDNLAPLVPCLTMPREELLAAIDMQERRVAADGKQVPIDPLIGALAEVRHAVGA